MQVVVDQRMGCYVVCVSVAVAVGDDVDVDLGQGYIVVLWRGNVLEVSRTRTGPAATHIIIFSSCLFQHNIHIHIYYTCIFATSRFSLATEQEYSTYISR